MSGNHKQSLERALKIVEEAAKSGVHMLKLQTYTADTLTINSKNNDFYADSKSLWKGKSLYELYKEAYTPWEWQEKIIKRSNELGMLCFSTPFDESAVDFLEKLKCPFYKVASFEMTDNNQPADNHRMITTHGSKPDQDWKPETRTNLTEIIQKIQ